MHSTFRNMFHIFPMSQSHNYTILRYLISSSIIVAISTACSTDLVFLLTKCYYVPLYWVFQLTINPKGLFFELVLVVFIMVKLTYHSFLPILVLLIKDFLSLVSSVKTLKVVLITSTALNYIFQKFNSMFSASSHT
jgi:hypothetical protein